MDSCSRHRHGPCAAHRQLRVIDHPPCAAHRQLRPSSTRPLRGASTVTCAI